MNKVKILVLGSTGMLGWVVQSYLEKINTFEVYGTNRDETQKSNKFLYFNAENFEKQNIDFSKFDYVINCIGIIKPYCKDNDAAGVIRAIKVNSQLPWLLSETVKNTNTKILQIATDCVYSGTKGSYLESDLHDALDVYGKTKSLGEVFDNNNFLNIRCSIIGPEKKGKLSLLEWFLSQPEGSTLNGFSHHLWNGVTTLQFAELCAKIIEKNIFSELRKIAFTHHFVPNDTVDKYQLLNIMNKVFNKTHTIKNVNDIGPKVDRTISSNFFHLREIYGTKTIETALQEIKSFAQIP